jgi:hypothetical protein
MLRIEYTDTFGGEANYSWVKRAVVPGKPKIGQREAMRRAKAAVGLTGVRGRTYSSNDYIEFRPYKMCTVLFVEFVEFDPDT